jgi:uncharacterized protein
MNFIRNHFKKLSLIGLILVVFISIFSAYELRKIKFDYDFESFFPVNDPSLDDYNDFRDKFEYDNEFVLLAIENKKGIFQQDFLYRVQDLTDSLRKIPDVTMVGSPTDLTYLTTSGKYPYIHLDDPSLYAEDSIRVFESPELVGSFFSTDRKAISLFIKTTDAISKGKSDKLLTRLQEEVARQHFDTVHLAGKLNGQKIYLERLQDEFKIFFIASFLLVVAFLYISFRSFWGVWVPILIVLLSILWTLALMVITGKSLDIMTVLLPTMMFVVGMSDVVHIVTKYLEELRGGKTNRFDALIKTIREVGFSTFITLVTTALGFLTLVNSNILPIRDFGIYTSIGVFIAFVLSFTIMPIVLNVLPTPNLKLESKTSDFWNKRLLFLLSWIFRKGKTIMVGAILLLSLSIWGISKIELNNYLIEGLTMRDQLRQEFIYFENKFSGVRPFEMIIKSADPNSTVLGTKELRAIDKLESYLKQEYGIGFMISPASIVKEGNKSLHDGNNKFFLLPESDSALSEISEEVKHQSKRKEIQRYISVEQTDSLSKNKIIGKVGRLSGKMHDIGSKNIRAKNKELDDFLAKADMKAIQVQITGAAVMLDKNNEYLVANTLQGLFFSILVVAIIIALIHRSWKMAIIAVIPNLLPIIFIGGIMGFAGIELKSSTSIIFSIAFGIATDDTVHFLGRLKLEIKNGRSLLYAVKRTFLSTGKAVIVTSFILSAGFMTLISSGFESTFYFGLLVSITLIIAVLTDLLLFPLLVVLFMPKTKKSR